MNTPNRNLKRYVQAERVRQALTPQRVAATMGYRNINKGANKLLRFEESGFIDAEVFEKLIDALGLDPAHIHDLTEIDRREEADAWEQWVNTPSPMEMIVRIIPGIYVSEGLPGNLTTPVAAVEFASAYAANNNRKACLRLSRKESVWIDEIGAVRHEMTKPYAPNEPYMMIRGGKCRFTFLGEKRAEDEIPTAMG